MGPIRFVKNSGLTPSFGLAPDQADDIRGGMGLEGLLNIRKFVEAGGIFAWIGASSGVPIDFGLVEGVTIAATRELNARGSVLQASIVDSSSPLSYGYGEYIAIYFNQDPVFQVGLGLGAAPASGAAARPTGRGSISDPDTVQGRPFASRSRLRHHPRPEKNRHSLQSFVSLREPIFRRTPCDPNDSSIRRREGSAGFRNAGRRPGIGASTGRPGHAEREWSFSAIREQSDVAA